jgi:hypothetical protein
MRPFVAALALALAACSAPPPGAGGTTSSRAAPSAVASAPPGPAAAPANGLVTLVCKPSCEEVTEDGKSLGPSPVMQHATPAGEHRYTLRFGALTKTLVLDVKPNEHHARRIDMDGETPAPTPTLAPDAGRDEVAAVRKLLEAKLQAGSASLLDLRMLRAICGGQGDEKCKERVLAEMKKIRGDEAEP